MAIHKWRKRKTRHFGEVWVPLANVELERADGKFQPFVLQIDSGAVVSLLRRSVAQVLQLELEAGRRVDVTSVGGGGAIAYVHELQTRFDPRIVVPVPFAIAESENVPNLLGRMDVFDPLQVDFDGTMHQTAIAAPWLSPEQRRIWDFMMETSDHILSRWDATKAELPETARSVVARFINRAAQVAGAWPGC